MRDERDEPPRQIIMGSAALVCVRSRSVLSVVIRVGSRQEKSPRRPRLRDGTRGACAHAPARQNTRASRLHSTEPCGTPAPNEESCAPSAPVVASRPVRGRPFPQAQHTNGQGVPTSAGLIRWANHRLRPDPHWLGNGTHPPKPYLSGGCAARAAQPVHAGAALAGASGRTGCLRRGLRPRRRLAGAVAAAGVPGRLGGVSYPIRAAITARPVPPASLSILPSFVTTSDCTSSPRSSSLSVPAPASPHLLPPPPAYPFPPPPRRPHPRSIP